MPSTSQLRRGALISLTCCFDRGLHQRLATHANNTGQHLITVIRQAVTEHLDRIEQRQKADQAFAAIKPALRDHLERDR